MSQQQEKYDYLVMIGDFAPFHINYESQLEIALTQAKQVIILVNNSFLPRNTDNPFTFEERKEMILSSVDAGMHFGRIVVRPLFNYIYDKDTWIEQVQETVRQVVTSLDVTIGLFSRNQKYVDMFPQWPQVKSPLYSDAELVASEIRDGFFQYEDLSHYTGNLLSPPISQWLTKFSNTVEFADLVKEYKFIQDYKSAWKSAPYAPTFATSDCVVTQSGHVLLVVRGAFPGKDQYAIPGGFLEQYETFQEGALRELKEETKIDVPPKMLLGNIVAEKTFDYPYRSRRGRTITQATHIALPDGPLPKVKGSDDAKKAIWVPFSEINSQNVFEDHFSILQYFIGSIKPNTNSYPMLTFVKKS